MMKVSRINQLNLLSFISALGFFGESCGEFSPLSVMMGSNEALQRSRLGLR